MMNPMEEAAGKALNNPRSAGELALQAGINKRVDTQPLYLREAIWEGNGGDWRYNQLKDHVAIRYGGNPVGIAGPNYKVLQVDETLSLLNPSIQSGILKPKHAGVLRGGRKIFLSSELDIPHADIGGKGDKVAPFITAIFDNSGGGSNYLFLSLIRIFCENTIRLALREKDKMVDSIRVMHKGEDPIGRQRHLSEVFCRASESFVSWTSDANHLASVSYTQAQRSEYLETLFPTKEDAKRKDNTQDSIAYLAVNGMGQRGSSTGLTWWGLVNGVTEYLDHHKSYRGRGASELERAENRKANRFESVLTGTSAKKKEAAFTLALEMATV